MPWYLIAYGVVGVIGVVLIITSHYRWPEGDWWAERPYRTSSMWIAGCVAGGLMPVVIVKSWVWYLKSVEMSPVWDTFTGFEKTLFPAESFFAAVLAYLLFWTAVLSAIYWMFYFFRRSPEDVSGDVIVMRPDRKRGHLR